MKSPWSTAPAEITLNGKRCGYRRDLTGDDLVYEMTLLVNKLVRGDVLRVPLAILGRDELTFGPLAVSCLITITSKELRFICL